MAQPTKKETKIMTRRRKFIDVDVPLINSSFEVLGNSAEEANGKYIGLDLTRQLRGKSLTAMFKIRVENGKAIAEPKKITLMPYFIKRMIRKRISYVEDSFQTPSQNSMIRIKPFLITRNRVSRAVRKALRNRCKNWIEDYIAERTDKELFQEILGNRLQKQLSLSLKKTYPLSLCEIRIFEIKRTLNPEEVPKIKEKPKEIKEKKIEIEQGIDQMAEIEAELAKKQAELEIKKTQEKASEIQEKEEPAVTKEENKEKEPKKKKTAKKEKSSKDTKEKKEK